MQSLSVSAKIELEGVEVSLPKVLLVEDDPQITKALSLNLSLSGYGVFTAETVNEARRKLGLDRFEIILLDVNLPDGNGIDLCHEVRCSGVETPILFLSARTDEETVVRAMNIGAEDYIRKPFGVEELKVRMSKALKAAPPPRDLVVADPLELDVGKRQARLLGEVMSLGRREFDILTVLAKKSGDVVSREAVITYLEQEAEIFDRTIDSHISHLRRKLREVGGDSLQILPVYGVGYRLHWTP